MFDDIIIDKNERLYGPIEVNKIAEAVKTMQDVFNKDEDFKMGYIANIAMLLHDRYGITNYEKRNQAAEDILKLIFY